MKRLLFTAALLVAGCTSQDVGVKPGTIALTLSGAGSREGALVLVISGGPVTSVSAAAGYQMASNTDDAGTHIMVTGDLANGTVATIAVPDRSRSGAYIVTVEQVADRTSFALLDPAPYRVQAGAVP